MKMELLAISIDKKHNPDFAKMREAIDGLADAMLRKAIGEIYNHLNKKMIQEMFPDRKSLQQRVLEAVDRVEKEWNDVVGGSLGKLICGDQILLVACASHSTFGIQDLTILMTTKLYEKAGFTQCQ